MNKEELLRIKKRSDNYDIKVYDTLTIKCKIIKSDVPDLLDEVKRLRKALERITEHRVNKFITKDKMVDSMFNIAKEALKEAK